MLKKVYLNTQQVQNFYQMKLSVASEEKGP